MAGVCHGLQASLGVVDDEKSKRLIPVAGFTTVIGSLLGTSPVVVATESGATIMEGARTGLAAIVMAALFLLSGLLAPIVAAIPRSVTAVPMVVVGAFMMAPCQFIAWSDLRVALPSFITMTVVPFTYSIHNGIIAGLVVDSWLGLIEKVAGLGKRT